MGIMNDGQRYIRKRVKKAKIERILFYLCRIFPIQRNKIVFCCIEGTTGYSCNPKYIANELINRNKEYELVWLVNDISKKFPKEIKVVRNTLWNRAFQLSTSHFWVDNSRKQLEVQKRKGQIYIQTWHAKLGFKPTCLDRGESFSKIAYLISKHDSEMIDYVLSNSKWYDESLPKGMLYTGSILRTGSPRCDILINGRLECRNEVRKKYQLPKEAKIIMYAPTFRGGSQEMKREIKMNPCFPDFERLTKALENRFEGKWYIFLRLHPQLVARGASRKVKNSFIVDVSKTDDMYEILAGCDAFITDYSSAAFDAAVMKVPIFLYIEDYKEYEEERGKLLWDLDKLPFPFAANNEELEMQVKCFNRNKYLKKLEQLFQETQVLEDGKAAIRVVNMIEKLM